MSLRGVQSPPVVPTHTHAVGVGSPLGADGAAAPPLARQHTAGTPSVPQGPADGGQGATTDPVEISSAESSAASDSAPLSSAPLQQPSRPATRLQHGIRKPRQYTDGTMQYGHLATESEPTNLSDALNNSQWRAIMDAEFQALPKNKTWHLVPPPHHKNIIGAKWVFKIRRKANGTINQYKARLVAKGYGSGME